MKEKECRYEWNSLSYTCTWIDLLAMVGGDEVTKIIKQSNEKVKDNSKSET